jgi:ethanolamine utilization protein EutN
MLLGRVIGTVWATRKDPKVGGMKWLVVRALKPDRKPLDSFVVAVDAVGAGVGETVLVTQGSSARQTELTTNKPVDAVIVAIVDDIEVAEKQDWAAFDRRTVADLAGPPHGS